jgi:hypothetical protein
MTFYQPRSTGTGINAQPPDTVEHHLRMWHCYRHEMRLTCHRHWAFVLLGWMARRRLRIAELKANPPGQREMF